ncbi:Uncharacterized protein FKW44_009405 [Caligus rogercresseyi]|uniref:PX domain-containing protein n=1 Tax=Caligus rogercresseyi TaxID=217165 RepID=A0A7T8HF42_CALRO|nr:Uncharacterized protein FKW44_009405 [Caligus rogercresseyi]
MESSRDLHSSNQQSQYIDYHYEASEYEKKLVQVAEMHGELLEFNEHLQKCLNNKDVLLRRYIDELELLRGPIELEAPEDTSEDVLSVDSLPATRPLISIWIPSVFLSGKYNNSSSAPSCTPTPSSKHHVYQVYLRIRDEEWNVYRRYSEFHALNKHLKKAESTVGSFDFPPKKSLGHRTDKVVEDRRARLQVYLRRVIHLMLKKNSSLADSPSKSTLTRLLPFFEEHRVSRDFDPEDLGDFRREDSHIVEEAVPQLAL